MGEMLRSLTYFEDHFLTVVDYNIVEMVVVMLYNTALASVVDNTVVESVVSVVDYNTVVLELVQMVALVLLVVLVQLVAAYIFDYNNCPDYCILQTGR